MKKSIKSIKKKILPVLKYYKVRRAGIFGSYATGNQKKSSDVDILVEIGKDLSLLDFVGLKHDLEDTLKMKVDLVEYGSIKPLLKERILNQEVPIL